MGGAGGRAKSHEWVPLAFDMPELAIWCTHLTSRIPCSTFSKSLHTLGAVVPFNEVEHPEVREAMLEVLPKIAPVGSAANELAVGVALLQTLDILDSIRSAAIATLAELSSKGSRVMISAAVGLLRDGNSTVRAAAARALLLVSRVDDDETLKMLALLLDEERSASRSGESVRNRAATLMTSVSRSTNALVKDTFAKHLESDSCSIRVTAIQGIVDMMENDHHPQVESQHTHARTNEYVYYVSIAWLLYTRHKTVVWCLTSKWMCRQVEDTRLRFLSSRCSATMTGTLLLQHLEEYYG